ncbi:hypothetical protein [Vreelandella titanicae]|uniref:hypothetical protein n=1 Tax=Vreelandella titanicae TaxID=664683 RepID=UPI0039BED6EE
MSYGMSFPCPPSHGDNKHLSPNYQYPITASPHIATNFSPSPQPNGGRRPKLSKVNLVRGIINASYRHVVDPDGIHFLMPFKGGLVLMLESEMIAPIIKKIVADHSQLDVSNRSIQNALEVIRREPADLQTIGNGRTWLGQNRERYIELDGIVMMFPPHQEDMKQPEQLCSYWHPSNSHSFHAPPMQGAVTDLKAIGDCIGLPKDRELLIYTYLVLCLMPDRQQLALELTGEHGSQMSKLQRLIKNLVDPVKKEPSIRDIPKTVKEADRYAWRHHVISLEDIEGPLGVVVQRRVVEYLSGIQLEWKAVGCHEDTSTLAVSRPCILSSSEPVVTHDALAEHTLSLEMPTVSNVQQGMPGNRATKRLDLSERQQAPIFNALLLLLGKVHATLHQVSIHREVPAPWLDFCEIGVIVSIALTKSDKGFWLQYEAYRKERLCEITEEEPVAQAIVKYMEINNIKETIEKPAGVWLAILAKYKPAWASESKWPREPRGLGSAFKRAAPLLEAQGITCYSNGKRGSKRHWVIGPKPPSNEDAFADLPDF